MKNHKKDRTITQNGLLFLTLIIVIGGQLFLLRNYFSATEIEKLPVCFLPELFFNILFFAGAVLCLFFPRKMAVRSVQIYVFSFFTLYCLLNIIFYSSYVTAYMTGYLFTFKSGAGALVALKLVLIFIGILAAIPTQGKIDNREYAKKLREKVHEQDAGWAAASLKAAEEDTHWGKGI